MSRKRSFWFLTQSHKLFFELEWSFEEFFNLRTEFVWALGHSLAADHLTFLIDYEFRKIPFDVVPKGSWPVLKYFFNNEFNFQVQIIYLYLLRFHPFIKRVCIVTINFDFLEKFSLKSFVFDKFFDVSIRARFLFSKLVARKSENF